MLPLSPQFSAVETALGHSEMRRMVSFVKAEMGWSVGSAHAVSILYRVLFPEVALRGAASGSLLRAE